MNKCAHRGLTTKFLKEFCASLVLFGLSLQMLSFSVVGQKRSQPKKPEIPVENVKPQTAKIAPDLEKSLEDSLFSGDSNLSQKVIITLKDDAANDTGQNTESSGILIGDSKTSEPIDTKIARNGGRLRSEFLKMGMVAAELPLSRVRELANDDSVAYISPDRPINAFGKLYSHYYKTTGAMDGYDEISGLKADGKGVGVAVLDSGMDMNHKLLKKGGNHPGVRYSKSFTGQPADEDRFGHGTHVASLLSGSDKFDNNQYGGIAQGVDIINLAVLNDEGKGDTSNAIAAIDWVISNKSTYNIRVISMSLGTPARDSYLNDPLCKAVRRAFNAGIVVVVSAGNFGKDEAGNKLYGSISSPGIEPSAITVGAANTFGTHYRSDDEIASFSSRGPTRGFQVVNGVKKYDNLIKPDLVAPGNKLISALSRQSSGRGNSLVGKNPQLFTGNSSKVDEKLMYLSGTSMAAPQVAGAVAMILQANPNLTPNLVKAILMFTAQQLNGYNSFDQGAGLMNIEGAMKITKFVKPNISSLSNGASMLTGSTYYNNTIQGEVCYWSQGIITNHGFLYGENLMKFYQGMYGNGVLISDSTPFTGGRLVASNSLTTAGLNLFQGSMTSNGVVMGDGYTFVNSSLMGNGVLLSDGVLLGDGVLISDGVLLSDTIGRLSVLGDNTAAMQLENGVE